MGRKLNIAIWDLYWVTMLVGMGHSGCSNLCIRWHLLRRETSGTCKLEATSLPALWMTSLFRESTCVPEKPC